MSLLASIKSALGVRGLGCRPDPEDPRDVAFGSMLLGITTPPPSADLGEFIPDVIRQSGNSCVGASIAQAVRIRMLASGWGARAFLPSRNAVYYWARACSGMQNQDSGTFLRDGIKVAKSLGLPSETAWPSKASTLMRQPNITALRDAADARKIGGYYRIPRGDTDSMRLAIASGHPVVFGMQLGQSFVDGTTGTIDYDTGRPRGGHAMVCFGYRDDRFRVLSSWGEDWSVAGTAFVTERRMKEGAFDCWAIDLLSR